MVEIEIICTNPLESKLQSKNIRNESRSSTSCKTTITSPNSTNNYAPNLNLNPNSKRVHDDVHDDVHLHMHVRTASKGTEKMEKAKEDSCDQHEDRNRIDAIELAALARECASSLIQARYRGYHYRTHRRRRRRQRKKEVEVVPVPVPESVYAESDRALDRDLDCDLVDHSIAVSRERAVKLFNLNIHQTGKSACSDSPGGKQILHTEEKDASSEQSVYTYKYCSVEAETGRSEAKCGAKSEAEVFLDQQQLSKQAEQKEFVESACQTEEPGIKPLPPPPSSPSSRLAMHMDMGTKMEMEKEKEMDIHNKNKRREIISAAYQKVKLKFHTMELDGTEVLTILKAMGLLGPREFESLFQFASSSPSSSFSSSPSSSMLYTYSTNNLCPSSTCSSSSTRRYPISVCESASASTSTSTFESSSESASESALAPLHVHDFESDITSAWKDMTEGAHATTTSASSHKIRNVRIGGSVTIGNGNGNGHGHGNGNRQRRSRFHLNSVESKRAQESLVGIMHVPEDFLEYLINHVGILSYSGPVQSHLLGMLGIDIYIDTRDHDHENGRGRDGDGEDDHHHDHGEGWTILDHLRFYSKKKYGSIHFTRIELACQIVYRVSQWEASFSSCSPLYVDGSTRRRPTTRSLDSKESYDIDASQDVLRMKLKLCEANLRASNLRSEVVQLKEELLKHQEREKQNSNKESIQRVRVEGETSSKSNNSSCYNCVIYNTFIIYHVSLITSTDDSTSLPIPVEAEAKRYTVPSPGHGHGPPPIPPVYDRKSDDTPKKTVSSMVSNIYPTPRRQKKGRRDMNKPPPTLSSSEPKGERKCTKVNTIEIKFDDNSGSEVKQHKKSHHHNIKVTSKHNRSGKQPPTYGVTKKRVSSNTCATRTTNAFKNQKKEGHDSHSHKEKFSQLMKKSKDKRSQVRKVAWKPEATERAKREAHEFSEAPRSTTRTRIYNQDPQRDSDDLFKDRSHRRTNSNSAAIGATKEFEASSTSRFNAILERLRFEDM